MNKSVLPGSVFKAMKYMRKKLSDKRYLHCLSTAYTAALLCERFRLDSEKGFFAGLVHDIAREWPEKKIRKYLLRSKESEDYDPSKNILLYHGAAGEEFLKEKFGVTDQDVLLAVRCHTLGQNLLPLIKEEDTDSTRKYAAIVYVADYLEFNRNHVSLAMKRKIFTSSLTKLVIMVKRHGEKYFNKQ